MLSKASNLFLDSSQAVYNPSNIWTAVDIIPHLYPVVKMEPQRVYITDLLNKLRTQTFGLGYTMI